MAKDKKTTETAPAAPIQRKGENPAFKRIGAVTLPTLKTVDGVPAYIMVTGEIVEKMTQGKNDDGEIVAKKIRIMPVVNLETGEFEYVVVAA